MDDSYQIKPLSGNERDRLLSEVEKRSRRIGKGDYDGFWHRYDKERQVTFSREEISIRLKNIERKIGPIYLLRSLCGIGKTLLKHLVFRIRFIIN